jgi:UDP-N-acetylglucosamine--N-acetylmuramyl-(pentapeptide) pyrophosphoryl-undecaprenol N-acetylglucosamine transferase
MIHPVVIAAGGTGGHVIPALAVADELRQRDIPVVWLGTKTGLEARLVPAAGIDIRWISVAGLRGKTILQTLIGPLKLIRSCLECMRLVYTLKPRAVLGMGGFVSGPVGIAALVLRKPLVIHEQNAVVGMTNHYLSRFAVRVFAAFPGAFGNGVKVQVVGNPVNQIFEEFATSKPHHLKQGADSSPLRILIVGGSRGARALNEIVPLAIAQLDASVAVHHQVGMHDGDLVRGLYQEATKAVCTVSEFIDDMADAYQNADLVICRSGAMTVTELSAIGLPSILVPFPYAVDDHQTKNAEYLSTVDAAVLIPQKELTPESLARVIRSLITDRTALYKMRVAARSCFIPAAAAVVANALVEVSI